MDDDMRSVLSGLLYSDTAYVFTVDDISSVVPVGQLDGFESQLVRYYYPSYVGSDSLYNVFRSGMVPEFGLFGISFAGTRNDTVYVFGAILRDGKCMALDKMSRSVPYDDSEAHRYILGDAGVEQWGDDCMALILHRYEAIRTDTAPHNLFSIYANVIAADTVVVCR